MQGRIYISSAFTNIKNVKCKPNKDWLDNDPHFWTNPPTWGICRTDFRKMLDKDDYVFFVLPKNIELPQMIYGYIRIIEKIPHIEAFIRFPNKRMKNGNPNGNIITDEFGNYNKYDLGAHRKRFENIKQYYVVGDVTESKFLKSKKIESMAAEFLPILKKIFDTNSNTIFQIIGRKGRKLNQSQIHALLNWLGK